MFGAAKAAAAAKAKELATAGAAKAGGLAAAGAAKAEELAPGIAAKAEVLAVAGAAKATEAAKVGASKAQEMGHRAAEAIDTAFTEIYEELPDDALGAKLLATDVFKGSDLLRMHDMCDAASHPHTHTPTHPTFQTLAFNLATCTQSGATLTAPDICRYDICR